MHLPESELEIMFSRSSGKGGQNVNKKSSRVQLRWNIKNSKFISENDKLMLGKVLKGKLTTSGDLIVVSERERSQIANLRDARYRMMEMVKKALIRPKKRLKTAPNRVARLKRMENKRKISLKKKGRKFIEY
jgi:ribosome-associated protein